MSAITYAEHIAMHPITEPTADAPWCNACKEYCTPVEVMFEDDHGNDFGGYVSECCDNEVWLSGKLMEPEAYEPDFDPIEPRGRVLHCGW